MANNYKLLCIFCEFLLKEISQSIFWISYHIKASILFFFIIFTSYCFGTQILFGVIMNCHCISFVNIYFSRKCISCYENKDWDSIKSLFSHQKKSYGGIMMFLCLIRNLRKVFRFEHQTVPFCAHVFRFEHMTQVFIWSNIAIPFHYFLPILH